MAMHRAKELGGNRVHFYEDGMNRAVADRFELVNELHEAIERNDFVVHYQPQVDVGSRKIVGVEALARWQHGERV